MSDNTAILAGYTKELLAEGGPYSLHLFVKPDADLDGRFKAYDADECEWIRVNGWLFVFETIADYSAEAMPILTAIERALGSQATRGEG